MKNLWIALFCTLILLTSSCSVKDDHSGITITGNTGKIAGYVKLPTVPTLSRRIASTDSLWKVVEVILAKQVDTGWVLDSIHVDSLGYFAFDSLAAGNYALTAHMPDGSVRSKGGIVLSTGEQLTINLQGGQQNSGDGFRIWRVDISTKGKIDTTINDYILWGVSHPSPLVSVRLYQASYVSYPPSGGGSIHWRPH